MSCSLAPARTNDRRSWRVTARFGTGRHPVYGVRILDDTLINVLHVRSSSVCIRKNLPTCIFCCVRTRTIRYRVGRCRNLFYILYVMCASLCLYRSVCTCFFIGYLASLLGTFSEEGLGRSIATLPRFPQCWLRFGILALYPGRATLLRTLVLLRDLGFWGCVGVAWRCGTGVVFQWSVGFRLAQCT